VLGQPSQKSIIRGDDHHNKNNNQHKNDDDASRKEKLAPNDQTTTCMPENDDMLEIHTTHPQHSSVVVIAATTAATLETRAVGSNDYHSPTSSRSTTTMLPQRTLQKTADSELSISIDDIASPEPPNNNRQGRRDRRPSNLSNVFEASEGGFGFSLSCWDNNNSGSDLDASGGGGGGGNDLNDFPSFQGKSYKKGNDSDLIMGLNSFQARYKRERRAGAPRMKNASTCSNQSIDLDDLTDSGDDGQSNVEDDEEEEDDYDTPPTKSPPEESEKLRKWGFRNGRKRTIRFNPQDQIHNVDTPSIEEYPILYYGVHELQKMMDDFKLEEKEAAEQARIARRAVGGLGLPTGAEPVVFHPPTQGGVLESETKTSAAQHAAVVARRAVLERHNGARGLSSTD
jgi:hypothetical protein